MVASTCPHSVINNSQHIKIDEVMNNNRYNSYCYHALKKSFNLTEVAYVQLDQLLDWLCGDMCGCIAAILTYLELD